MIKSNKQRGVTFTGILLFVILIAILGTYGVQIGIGYLDKNSLERIVKTALTEAKSSDSSSATDIKTSIMKKASVNNINIKSDDITVQKDGGGVYSVDLEYNKEIKITKNVKVVMDYNISDKTP